MTGAKELSGAQGRRANRNSPGGEVPGLTGHSARRRGGGLWLVQPTRDQAGRGAARTTGSTGPTGFSTGGADDAWADAEDVTEEDCALRLVLGRRGKDMGWGSGKELAPCLLSHRSAPGLGVLPSFPTLATGSPSLSPPDW